MIYEHGREVVGQNSDASLPCGPYNFFMGSWERDRECRVAAIRQEAVRAVVMANLAEEAYRTGSYSWATFLHAAEQSHTLILSRIASLTDDGADLLEPVITSLEKQLCRVSQLWRALPDSGVEMDIGAGIGVM